MDASEVADPAPESGLHGQVTRIEVGEAASRLRELVDQVLRGADVVLSVGDIEVRLVLIPAKRRVLGQDAGLFEVPDDFDAPLPDAVLDAFGS